METFFFNITTDSDTVYYALMFIFIITLMMLSTVFFLYRKNKRRYRETAAELYLRKNQQFELEKLIHLMAQQGKMSFIITSVDNELLSPSVTGDIKIIEKYVSNMLPDDREKFRSQIRKIFSGALDSFQEHCTLIINGCKRHHINSVVSITLPESSQKKIILLSTDITEIEEQNTHLANANSVLGAIFDNLPGHIFLKNTTSDFTYARCNPSYSGLLQKNPADLIGKSDFDLFDRNLASRIRSCDLNVARNRNIADNRWFFSTPDGKEHAIRFITRTLQLSDGSECILGFGVDISQQEYIAQSLRRRNKALRAFISQLPFPAILWNSDLNLSCSTTVIQDHLASLNSDQANAPASCSKLFNCPAAGTPQCAAWQAAESQSPCTCSYAVIGKYQLAVKALFNANGDLRYYFMAPIETLFTHDTSKDLEQ